MLGSNFIIIERMKDGVFFKFALHFMGQNGFTQFTKFARQGTEGIDFTAYRDSVKHIIRVEKSKEVIDLSFIKSIAENKDIFSASHTLIVTPQEFTQEAIKYSKDNNIILFGRLEIESWLQEKFNSCESFINYLDEYYIKRTGKYTAKELAEHYFQIKKNAQRRPNEHDMRLLSDIGSGYYFYKWGTWNNFLASIGENINILNFNPNRTQTASLVELIECYVAVRKNLNRPPTTVDIDTLGKYPHEYYLLRFGSWSNLVMLIENEIEKAKAFNPTEMYEEFLRVKNKLNKTPTYTDMRIHSTISPISYIYKYHRWNDFLDAINESPQFSNIDDKVFIKAYLELEKRLNKKPSYIDIKKHYKYSSQTLEFKFGQWSNFTRLMQDKEFATLEIKEIDIFNDFYRIRNVLNKEEITIFEIERHTWYSIQDYLNNFESWDNFFATISQIDRDCELISKEMLIYEYLSLMEKLNMTSLTLYDIKKHCKYHYPIFLCKFRSWAEFIIVMKDYVRLNKRVLNVTNIELVEEYFRLEKQLGISPLSYTDVKNHCKYSPDTYTIRFGSWKKFMASIGLKSTNDIDKEDVIKEYYRLKVSLNKRVILGTDFTKYSKYSMTVVNRLFGGWINLLSEIQEDSNYYQRPTDDELITEFYRVKQLLGRDRIYAKDMDQVGKYSRACYIGHFGNWRKFLAHLNENMSRERISNNYLIDEYRRVKEISGKEYITVKDFEKLSGHSFAIFYTRFGSWNKFLISIGETPSYRIDWDNLTNEELVNEYYSVRIKLNKKFPSIDDNDKNGKFMRYVYKKRFGKWSNFIKYVKKLDEQQSNSESLKCIKS